MFVGVACVSRLGGYIRNHTCVVWLSLDHSIRHRLGRVRAMSRAEISTSLISERHAMSATNPVDLKPGVITYKRATEEYDLSRATFRRLVEAGYIRTARFGRAVRLRADDIEALIQAGGVDSDRLAS